MLRNLKIALLSSLLMVGVWLTGCEKEKQKAVEVIRPVRTITVGATEAGRQRTFSGTAHAGLESRLSFKVPGTLKRLAVNAGDKVKKGALIGELEAKDFDLQVEQARASLAQAQAQSRNAKAAYARARELDQALLGALLTGNQQSVSTGEACGRAPVVTAMHLAQHEGWQPHLLDYRSSGDTGGDKGQVVGYASVAYTAA